MSVAMVTVPSFVLPRELSATKPPEARGLERDEVRLLVEDGIERTHARFWELGRFLRAGDLLVVNQSATLAAALDGHRGHDRVVVHLSAELDDGTWVLELRQPDASGPVLDGAAGEMVRLAKGGLLRLLGPYRGVGSGGVRLWRADIDVDLPVIEWLGVHGRPIAYGYVEGRWPLSSYQPVFGQLPGSAEMPSAGRPFSTRLVTELVAKGVGFAPIVLHTGVSSLEVHEPPQAERFQVSANSARLINQAKAAGGRIIAVGTTATRAVETVVSSDGRVRADSGWTELVLGPESPTKVIDGIITGWHEPGASHLMLLEAVVGAATVASAYAEALQEGYLWHEFGDSALLLR